MDSRRVCGTGHPQVFIDGGGGDDITVHRRDFPVAVWEGHPNHEPGNKPQEEGKGFHYRVHASFEFLSQAGKLCRAGPSAPEVQRPGTLVITSKALMLSKSPNESLIPKNPLKSSSIVLSSVFRVKRGVLNKLR